MNIVHRASCYLGVVAMIVLAGCGASNSSSVEKESAPLVTEQAASVAPSVPANQPTSLSVNWNVKELPYDYAAMKEDVLIQLDEEPRLHSPLRTVVGPAPQAYTFFFREPMDQSSVEAAVRLHAVKQEDNGRYVEPNLAFRWVHDRQLHLLAALPPATSLTSDDWPGPEYVLSAEGAETKKGRRIGESLTLRAVVLVPNQLWRMSVDGKVKEKLTDFSVSYGIVPLQDPEGKYWLLTRSLEYCQCDARHVPLYAVYDMEKRSITRYPVELMQQYRGTGNFVADRRGFFYAHPEKGSDVPPSPSAVPVKVNGYVHGASFSLDHRRILLAVGAAEQKKDLDLLVYDLESGQQQRLPKVISGVIPTSESDGVVLPVVFNDDGRQATFIMRKNDEDLTEVRHRYDWRTGKVASWDPPVPIDSWAGYVQSDDGAYQMFWNAGLFRGRTHIMDQGRGANGIWIPYSHHYVFMKWDTGEEGKPPTQSLLQFDADHRRESILSTGLPSGADVIGASLDGKWLYVRSDQDLEP